MDEDGIDNQCDNSEIITWLECQQQTQTTVTPNRNPNPTKLTTQPQLIWLAVYIDFELEICERTGDVTLNRLFATKCRDKPNQKASFLRRNSCCVTGTPELIQFFKWTTVDGSQVVELIQFCSVYSRYCTTSVWSDVGIWLFDRNGKWNKWVWAYYMHFSRVIQLAAANVK